MDQPVPFDLPLMESICIEETTLTDVPSDLAAKLAVPDAGPLIAVVFRGVIPSRQLNKIASVIGAPDHLGQMVGRIQAAIDRKLPEAKSLYVSAYDQAYALERERPWGTPT